MEWDIAEGKKHVTRASENPRCPSCGQEGMRIQYGMPAGPPGPGVVLGGCIVDPESPDFVCSTCGTSWRITPQGPVPVAEG